MVKTLPGYTMKDKLLLNGYVDPESGCWRWPVSHDKNGYGIISVRGGRSVGVHRVAYQMFIGPIPERFHVDHVLARGCVNRDCFNPEHLEAVTAGENVRRQAVAKNQNSGKTHCKHGHEFTAENTYTSTPGHRHCRECARLRTQRQRDARRATGGMAGHTITRAGAGR